MKEKIIKAFHFTMLALYSPIILILIITGIILSLAGTLIGVIILGAIVIVLTVIFFPLIPTLIQIYIDWNRKPESEDK